MTEETYSVDVWFTDERRFDIEAESPEEALEKAKKQFRMVESGTIDSITVNGTVEGNATKPLDNEDGYVRQTVSDD